MHSELQLNFWCISRPDHYPFSSMHGHSHRTNTGWEKLVSSGSIRRACIVEADVVERPPHSSVSSELWRDVLLPGRTGKVTPHWYRRALCLTQCAQHREKPLHCGAGLTAPGGASESVHGILQIGPLPLPLPSWKHLILYPVTADLPCASSSLLQPLCWCHTNQMPSRLSHAFPDSLECHSLSHPRIHSVFCVLLVWYFS